MSKVNGLREFQNQLIIFNIDLHTFVLILQQNIDNTLQKIIQISELQQASKPRGQVKNTRQSGKINPNATIKGPSFSKKSTSSKKELNELKQDLSDELDILRYINSELIPYDDRVKDLENQNKLLKKAKPGFVDNFQIQENNELIEKLNVFKDEHKLSNSAEYIKYKNDIQIESIRLHDLEEMMFGINDKLVEIRDRIKKLLGSDFDPELTKSLVYSSTSKPKKIIREYTTKK
jgi:hypothetical protein